MKGLAAREADRFGHGTLPWPGRAGKNEGLEAWQSVRADNRKVEREDDRALARMLGAAALGGAAIWGVALYGLWQIF